MEQLQYTTEQIDNFFEVVFHKRTPSQKKKIKRKLKIAHRGTNWEKLKQVTKKKKGWKLFKIPGGKRYILKRLSQKERTVRGRIGKQLGKKTTLRR